MCRLMLMLLGSLLVSSLAGAHFSGETKNSRSRSQTANCAYSLVLAKSTFSQSEPILLRLAVTNSSEQPLPVSLGYDREGAFVFTIKGPNGSVIELPRKRTREGLSRLGTFMVKAKSSYTQQLILNDWYDFPDPGVYEINVRLKSSRQPESECLNATFAIEIVPLDKQQLRQSCEELVEVVRENVQNFENASDAAKALLIIKHPVAVPCLEGALKANHAVSSFVIAGLEEIGNEEAVQVLISLLGNPNPDDSDFVQARAALFAIEKKTTDPATLELIKKALSRAEARAAKSN